MKKTKLWLTAILTSVSFILSACSQTATNTFMDSVPAFGHESNEHSVSNGGTSSNGSTSYGTALNTENSAPGTTISLENIPPYAEEPYITVNDNIPYFTEEELSTESFELYSELDDLGRCQTAYASIGTDLMPTEKRGSISQIKPTGWHAVKYDSVEGHYLYNRCHLIGFQLSGENANPQNLITGTRYMNVTGMLPFENMVADYVKESENHVMYRVTPIFEGDNLLASGVLIEAQSVEDKGKSILFCVYVYNVQPGIAIDYATGESRLDPNSTLTNKTDNPAVTPAPEITYILNTNTLKFHYPDCSGLEKVKEENIKKFVGDREEIISQGYLPCKICNP